MRRRTACLAGAVALATLLSAVVPVSRQFIWNATASVPTGLYHIGGKSGLQIGDRVAIEPPPALRRYLAARGYLPAGIPLIKDIAALPGQTVCRSGSEVTVDDQTVGWARTRDSRGRSLPVWQGCRTLARDEIFAMNRSAPGSFDGRYFGVLARKHLIGQATPVWTDEAGNGARVWFARPTIPCSPTTNQGDLP